MKTGSRTCPWCEIEKGGGPDLFISITASAKLNSTFDVNLVWRRVETIPAPKPVGIGAVGLSTGTPPAALPTAARVSGFVTSPSGGRFLAHTLSRMPPSKGSGLGVPVFFVRSASKRALDVTEERVGAVDGFGPARTSGLVGWQRSVEAKFRFDPNKALDPGERAALIQRQSQRRATSKAALTKVWASCSRCGR